MKQCWIPRSMRKKGLGPRASQTAGIEKGWNCHRDPVSASMAKRNRSHKDPAYSEWSLRHRGGKTPYFP